MLSGGQKQKVAIASVLAMKPEIILFDESTSMLDPRGRKDIKKIMTSLRGKHTIISITHDMNEIINSDSVIVMNDGKVLMHDTPDVVLKQEQLLKSIHLDVPFVLKVISGLKADNVPVQ